MVIPSDRLPFRVVFIPESFPNRPIPVTRFTDSRAELNQGEIVGAVLTEDMKYRLAFVTESRDARLYLDMLDSLTVQSTGLQVDEDDVPYMAADSGSVALFIDDYIPWIPSLYYLCVRTNDGTYYSTVSIRPKLISADQLRVLREELKKDVAHLAFQLTRRFWDEGGVHEADGPQAELMKIDRLAPIASHLVAAAVDLADRSNFRIVKQYERVPAGLASQTDAYALRRMASRPSDGSVVALRRELSQDLPENRWLVHMSESMRKFLEHALRVLMEYDGRLKKQLDDLRPYRHKRENAHRIAVYDRARQDVARRLALVRKVLYALRNLAMTPWYQSIQRSAPRAGTPPFTHVLVQDPRYRAFFEAHRVIRRDDIEIRVHPEYTIEWRPTSELYELWTFMQVAKHLMGQGFDVVEQPMAHLTGTASELVVDPLRSGDTLVFQRGDVVVRLAYDLSLPARADQTSFSQPLYTIDRHNRPDGILSVYKDGIYRGSVVLDAKYRKVRNFWDLTVAPGQRPHAMNQICSYASGCRSPHLFGSDQYSDILRPVREVWALHPREGADDRVEVIPDYAVKVVPLTPGEVNAHLGELLDEALRKILSFSLSGMGV